MRPKRYFRLSMSEEGSTVYVRATNARLRDLQLHEHMRTFGEIASVWVPWKAGDKRSFGFITFRESTVATMVVKASPHIIGGSEVICELKTSQLPKNVGQNRRQKQDSASDGDGGFSVSDFLKPIDQGQHCWAQYLAPSLLKEELQLPAGLLAEIHQGPSVRAWCRYASSRIPCLRGAPIPPGRPGHAPAYADPPGNP